MVGYGENGCEEMDSHSAVASMGDFTDLEDAAGYIERYNRYIKVILLIKLSNQGAYAILHIYLI